MSYMAAGGPRDRHPSSYYAAITTPLPAFPAFRGQAQADLCVVGGGLTGLSTAFHAARAGQTVILLEAARIGWGASGRNGGQVGTGFNWDPSDLEARLGAHVARALWREAEEAKSNIKSLIAQFAPEADFRPGALARFLLDHVLEGEKPNYVVDWVLIPAVKEYAPLWLTEKARRNWDGTVFEHPVSRGS